MHRLPLKERGGIKGVSKHFPLALHGRVSYVSESEIGRREFRDEIMREASLSRFQIRQHWSDTKSPKELKNERR
jgi:hypothetical protein